MTDLSWRDTIPDDPMVQPGTLPTPERARDGEPEPIGSVHRYRRVGAGVVVRPDIEGRPDRRLPVVRSHDVEVLRHAA